MEFLQSEPRMAGSYASRGYYINIVINGYSIIVHTTRVILMKSSYYETVFLKFISIIIHHNIKLFVTKQ